MRKNKKKTFKGLNIRNLHILKVFWTSPCSETLEMGKTNTVAGKSESSTRQPRLKKLAAIWCSCEFPLSLEYDLHAGCYVGFR